MVVTLELLGYKSVRYTEPADGQRRKFGQPGPYANLNFEVLYVDFRTLVRPEFLKSKKSLLCAEDDNLRLGIFICLRKLKWRHESK